MAKLSDKQIAAIEFMALPQRGNLTYAEIAEKVGVSEMTLYRWKNDDTFHNALTRRIIRSTADRLPEVMASIPDHIINDGNAAMLRTLLQAHGLLTDKVEVETKNTTDDTEALRAKVDALRQRKVTDEE